jgi:hypothetical protein
MIRLGIKPHAGTSSSYPQAGDPSISVRGLIAGPGGAFDYQAWFRVFPSLCGFNSNLTNGLSVVWRP